MFHFRLKDSEYGLLTLLFLFLPFLYSFTTESLGLLRGTAKLGKHNLQCLYHLPFVQVLKHYEFFKLIILKTKEMMQHKNFLKMLIDEAEIRFTKLNNEEKEEMFWEEFIEVMNISQEEKKLLESKISSINHLYEEDLHDYKEVLTKAFKEDELKLIAEMTEIQTEVQKFKLLEILCESSPQFILQMSISLHNDPLLQNDKLKDVRKIFTIASSFFSVVSVMAATLLKMPYELELKDQNKSEGWFMKNNCSTRKESPFQSWKNMIIVIPIMILIVTPRLLSITILFAITNSFVAIVISSVALCIYTFLFYYLVLKQNYGKVQDELLSYSFFTSIYGPAIVIDPRKDILNGSNLAAMFGHFTILLSLIITNSFFHDHLIIDVDHLDEYLTLFCYLILIISSATFLGFYLNEDRRQIIGLKLPFFKDSLCCPKEDQLIWAIKRKYRKVIDFYSKFDMEKSPNKNHYGNWFGLCKDQELHDIIDYITNHQNFGQLLLASDRKGMNVVMAAICSAESDLQDIILEKFKSSVLKDGK